MKDKKILQTTTYKGFEVQLVEGVPDSLIRKSSATGSREYEVNKRVKKYAVMGREDYYYYCRSLVELKEYIDYRIAYKLSEELLSKEIGLPVID